MDGKRFSLLVVTPRSHDPMMEMSDEIMGSINHLARTVHNRRVSERTLQRMQAPLEKPHDFRGGIPEVYRQPQQQPDLGE